jgi:outer membrane protein insertion porin family
MRIHSFVVASALWAAPAFAQATMAPIAPATPAAPQSAAQAAGAPFTVCEGAYTIPPPANLPPAGSGPVVYVFAPCFARQGNVPLVEAETYLYYIQLQPSLPSRNEWKPYNEQTEQTIIDDHKRLWATGFLDDLSIEAVDYPFSNGVIGKIIVYNMEERQRIKNFVYNEGTKEVDQAKIEEKLRELGISQIRLDSFVDPATEKRISNVIREMMAEKGFQEARVDVVHEPLPGGPKSVALKFKVTEGPKVKVSNVDFVGNQVFSDGKLKRRMKQNKGGGFWIFPGSGIYQEDKFEEDAQNITDYYRERGYIEVNVGEPNLKKLRDSSDGKTRYMTLEIPVTEGRRLRIGEFAFEGNVKVPTEALRPLFKLEPGDFYNEKRIRDGLEKSREIYGSAGHFEFTGFPDNAEQPDKPIVNVTMRLQEGKQYFINRITFLGNTTTRDNVIRREMRLYENGVFNTEALKFSVRRLNQLGYFKPLEDQKNIVIDKTPNADNKVDLSLKLEEQNRNQLSFGAGVSQYDGVFGQLSFSTANFMGRGESLTLSMQAGARAHDYQIAFTEPFLFDRPITGSIDLHKRDIRYIDQFTQGSTGGNITFGFPLANFSRAYIDYSYDRVRVSDLNQAFFDSSCYLTNSCASIDIANLTTEQLLLVQSNPFLYDSLLIGQAGRRVISKVTPTFALNSIDNPVTPVTGRRYTASFAVAGLGGDTRYVNPTLEGVWFLQQNQRISLGLRAQAEYIKPLGTSSPLPIFERLVLGGGYSVRGYDLRTIGPKDSFSQVVIGGNKSLLFNAEYLISVAGPVRLILFYDAGQVKDTGQRFHHRDFITSTGAEIRFFMPVLNVPFRLIFASNPQRKGILNSGTLLPEKAFRFRFDVGSTF